MARREVPEWLRHVLPAQRQEEDFCSAQGIVGIGELSGHSQRHDDLSYVRQPSVCESQPSLSWDGEGQQYGYGETQSWQPKIRRALFVGETQGEGRNLYPGKQAQADGTRKDVRSEPFYSIPDQKRQAVEVFVSVKSLTLKRRELRESPNGWCRGQSAAKPLIEERSTTIPTGSTLKRAEVRRTER